MILSKNLAYILLAVGIVLMFVGIFLTYILLKVKSFKNANKNNFNIVAKQTKEFKIWQHYAFIALMFLVYVCAIVLICLALQTVS
ncbi:hypothetical protein SCLARK_001540 [Spiroplasma clarkii]|uniref:Uncharacterized protein n=1 Tax=Spiroplasma clarkii TaxID=2139 RepID=A0A1Y0L2Q5_9MOLU|nr:hypothetical protein [Spiroplasma clarkii]ARU92050.1 hypothetical protein SCLARK_001540 [Spiroplasma clarkii]ATX71377.1 hypothetical protein SCLAR_v1c10770 [Spiroplasma clarkii]